MADAAEAVAKVPVFKKKKLGKSKRNKRKREEEEIPQEAESAPRVESAEAEEAKDSEENVEEATVVRPVVTTGAQRKAINSFGEISKKPKTQAESFSYQSSGLTSVDHKEAVTRKDFTHGPLRASSSIRTICRFDFQPDICKDYKETGFCGYGDTCKFMHDRSDYKGGWQLEREWEEQQKKQREREAEAQLLGMDVSELEAAKKKEEEAEDLPFACHICREKFTLARNPVVTLCGHYFCQECALARSRKDGTCAVCGKATGGVFNVGRKLIARVRERDARHAND
eukprot:scaffold822_cov250-Pinguiococcus_pyrenoidosus.AAC.1